MGTLYTRLERWAEALRCYRRSLRWRPYSALTWLCLAYALRASGREDEARHAWGECIWLAPDSPQADEARRRLAERRPARHEGVAALPAPTPLAATSLPLTG